MYSEVADFKEKETIYSGMVLHISQFTKRDWVDVVKGGLALEIGGAGGLLGGLISNIAGRVICTDIIDSQVQYNGEFPKLLKDKFERNGQKLDLRKIEFHAVDAQQLIYMDNLFDLVFSQNALEHIPDPVAAIREALRVLKPGGIFYATFDPVWTEDSGSHFFEFVKDPWLHILLTDDEFCERMRNGGAQDWQIASYRTDMNRLPSSVYRQQIPLLLGTYAQKFEFVDWRGCIDNSFVNHENHIKAATKLNCDPNDLLIRGFRILAVK